MTTPSDSLRDHYSPPQSIVLAGERHFMRRDSSGQRFIGDETVGAFIEPMTLLRREDVLADLAAIGHAALRGKLTCGSAQQTVFGLHQQRTRSN